MKSVTKTTISETSVFDAVRKHFPSTISVRAEELKGGAFNTAYLVTSEGSPSLRGVMKIGPSQSAKTLTYEKDIMRTESRSIGCWKTQIFLCPKSSWRTPIGMCCHATGF